jgi:hypothetical protein
MKRKAGFTLALIALALFVGCAKEPTDKITAANQAFDRAGAPQVSEYAPDAVAAARDAKSKLDTELQTQRDKMALFRNYDHATELASQLESSSQSAVTAAEAGKQKAKQEASAAIEEARRMLDEARSLLAEAPVGKGTQADVALLKNDLDGVEQSINEANNSIASEHYMEARSKADSARMMAENVKNQVLAAKKARGGDRTGRT